MRIGHKHIASAGRRSYATSCMENDTKALRESAALARRLAAMTTNDALSRQLEDLADEYELQAKEVERRQRDSEHE
jgi:hypothetical protein